MSNLSGRNIGLILFVVCVAVDVLVLLVDDGLAKMGWPTISDWVWAWRPRGIPLVAWQLLAPVGLSMHLFCEG